MNLMPLCTKGIEACTLLMVKDMHAFVVLKMYYEYAEFMPFAVKA